MDSEKEHQDQFLFLKWKDETELLRDRFIFLAEYFASTKGKYAYLESRTGIPAARWQNVFLYKQMPSIEMLLSLIHYRRENIEWLLTGNVKKGLAMMEQKTPNEEAWNLFLEHKRYLNSKKGREKES
ncbi:hypothetical protein ACO0KY_18635 [Undibacterium sp. Dicai25W]|uniref:hypothetical protein n=1 Tax=Undibacterium sp. Dicai25W TaxID=3413034 RepID=UPI003BF1399B